ncbi:unnamed protein product [Rotaria sordida]|uniref:Integral membrane bound transporter domain-containing protein n=2 Tax=Rotaria sordida TaxID=392033 RepID=A0A818RAB6_9BILA|nr:unnamed protein product [Rotaria sordida]CAF3651353.1 unnamed protein product [Rotaria sordida]
MSISTFFQTLCHFYFNYHYNNSSSKLTPSAFSRRIQFAIRMTISFLIGGFLAYATPLNNQLTTQYLIPVTCIVTIQETFGMTLSAGYQMLTAITPLSIFLFIVQKIGLGYKDYLAAELTLLISSFLVAYKCSQVQTRKIALLINAIFFSTIVNEAKIPSTFIFTLLEEFVIAVFVGLIVSISIFPLFATFDVENRVNYCLTNLQQVETIVVQAFLCKDQMSAQVSLARASTIEQMVRTTMNLMHSRLNEAHMEPSRCLQRIFNRRRRHLIDLTLQEQEYFISALMFHVCSLQIMVKQCQFNEYHRHFTEELQESLLHLSLCQSTIVSSLISSPIINRDEFNGRLTALQQALDSLRTAFIEARLHHVEHVLESAKTILSEDHLSHTFFLFQLDAIVRLLIQATTIDQNKSFFQEIKDAFKTRYKKKRRTVIQVLKPQWPRFVSAFKSMVIIGVGSIFVMVPRLATAFENGQWILIALCMTQGDTVGGAFTTMKMRLVGTLFGAMWAYVTYLSVNDHIYHTLGMLTPWMLIFGYLKLLPNWSYAATVAAFTPALVNLGRIPYGDTVPGGNYALLRIEENLVGIAVAIVLTIVIFPVFAIDVLKNNIQSTLQVCRESITSMHSIYDQLAPHENLDIEIIDVEKKNEQEIKSVIDAQRSRFQQLISSQRILVGHAALEPTMWWFHNNFSSIRYDTLVEQQVNMFRMLYNIDAILMHINECIDNDKDHIKNLHMHTAGSLFLPDLHIELVNLSRQLSDCLSLWSSYFALTQTRSYRIFRDCTYSRTKLNESDLSKHEQHLIELHHTIDRLQNQHQNSINRILKHYLNQLTQGELPSKFIPYVENDKADLIIIGISAMYYSTTQLAQIALALGVNIHTIFELETTHLYRPF